MAVAVVWTHYFGDRCSAVAAIEVGARAAAGEAEVGSAEEDLVAVAAALEGVSAEAEISEVEVLVVVGEEFRARAFAPLRLCEENFASIQQSPKQLWLSRLYRKH